MWDSRLHTEVLCFACLREAPPCGTKAGYPGVQARHSALYWRPHCHYLHTQTIRALCCFGTQE